jgi:hypothetical protein
MKEIKIRISSINMMALLILSEMVVIAMAYLRIHDIATIIRLIIDRNGFI